MYRTKLATSHQIRSYLNEFHIRVYFNFKKRKHINTEIIMSILPKFLPNIYQKQYSLPNKNAPDIFHILFSLKYLFHFQCKKKVKCIYKCTVSRTQLGAFKKYFKIYLSTCIVNCPYLSFSIYSVFCPYNHCLTPGLHYFSSS